jgi:hypothetical protein
MGKDIIDLGADTYQDNNTERFFERGTRKFIIAYTTWITLKLVSS